MVRFEFRKSEVTIGYNFCVSRLFCGDCTYSLELSPYCHFPESLLGTCKFREENRWMVKELELSVGEEETSASAPRLGTILIVEDDPRMQKVLQRVFGGEHYDVITAGDGQTGL